MHQAYKDITSRLGEPLWYDEHAVPRYDPFKPGMKANIYATEVALVRIRCQYCGKRMKVAMSWAELDQVRQAFPSQPLSQYLAENNWLHYGDPPWHDCVGDTMTCEDDSVAEFWARSRLLGWEWERKPELEIVFEEA